MNHLLMYNIPPEKAGKIKAIALRHGFRIRVVQPEEFGRSIAALAGFPETQVQGDGTVFSDEMLVMAGFSPALMNRLLQTFRQMKIPPVPLKAMLTETNGRWDSCRLYREISAEHEAMTRGGAPMHQGPQA